MTHIEREVISRPVEEVFDFLADGRNEPYYNPHMLLAEQTSAEPIGHDEGPIHGDGLRDHRL